MNRIILLLLSALVLPVAVMAQEGGAHPPLQVRAMLHDPVNPVADLFVADKTGKIVRLELSPGGLSQPLMTIPQNGSFVFFDKAEVDLKNPQASLAASVKVPAGCSRCILIILRNGPDKKPAFRLLFQDDPAKGFTKGESRILSLVPADTAVEVGEHKLSEPSGKIISVPAVKKFNEFNMAQTNFYYKDGQQWMPFNERQVQYLEEYRRIFVIHVTPGSNFPIVTTVVDTATPPETVPEV